MVLLAAGLDSAELISQLRAAHAEDNTRMGVDVVLGKAGDMADLGIYECYRVSMANAPCCLTCTVVICKPCFLNGSFDYDFQPVLFFAGQGTDYSVGYRGF
jgi:hypothetical protein